MNMAIGKRICLPFCILAVFLLGQCKLPSDEDTLGGNEENIHERPSWSPDGQRIAFTGFVKGTYGIYLVDTTRATVSLLRSGEAIGVQWSPDAQWLVYSANGSLYKIKAAGDSLNRLTVSASDIRPAWSPDGNQIAYVRSGIWLLDLKSGTSRFLSAIGDYPSWHPNGEEVIALHVRVPAPTDPQNRYEFIAIRVSDGSARTLSSVGTSGDIAFSSASPTGNEIAFSVLQTDFSRQIYKLALPPPTKISQLTTNGGDYPAWSPDGQMIVYTRFLSGAGTLWLMKSDGTQQRQLTRP